ncbi:unnamed protein product [Lota lota]
MQRIRAMARDNGSQWVVRILLGVAALLLVLFLGLAWGAATPTFTDHDPRETVPGEGTRRPGRWDRRAIGTIQDPGDRYEAVKLQYTAGTKMVFTFDLCSVTPSSAST